MFKTKEEIAAKVARDTELKRLKRQNKRKASTHEIHEISREYKKLDDKFKKASK